VQDRLARDRKDRPSEDELKTLREAADRLTELENANKSELEKAQAAAEKAAKERDEALNVGKAATENANKALIRASVVAEAAKQGAVDTDAVVALLPADKVTIGDDGEVAGTEDAVTALLEAKPFLVGKAANPGNGGARTPVAPKDLAEQIAEAEKNGDQALAMSLKTQQLLALPKP
jgi:hypothetical protein